MVDWNFDMSTAPRDRRILLKGAGTHVTPSRWLPVDLRPMVQRKIPRWEFFCDHETPEAWAELPPPKAKPSA